jgi:hypothetical protein
VIAAEYDRHRAGFDDVRHRGANGPMATVRVARRDRRIAGIHDLQLGEGVDAEVHVPCARTRVVVGGPDRSGAEAGSRPVSDHVVHRGSEDRDVRSGQLFGIEDERGLHERWDSRVGSVVRSMQWHLGHFRTHVRATDRLDEHPVLDGASGQMEHAEVSTSGLRVVP